MLGLFTKNFTNVQTVRFGNIYQYLLRKYGKVYETLCYIPVETYIGDGDQMIQSVIGGDFSPEKVTATLGKLPFVNTIISNVANNSDFKESLGSKVENVVIRLVAKSNTSDYCTEVDLGDGIVLIIT